MKKVYLGKSFTHIRFNYILHISYRLEVPKMVYGAKKRESDFRSDSGLIIDTHKHDLRRPDHSKLRETSTKIVQEFKVSDLSVHEYNLLYFFIVLNFKNRHKEYTINNNGILRE